MTEGASDVKTAPVSLSASPPLPRPGMKRSYPLTARVPWRLAPLLLSYAIGKSVTLIPNSRYTWYRGAD